MIQSLPYDRNKKNERKTEDRRNNLGARGKVVSEPSWLSYLNIVQVDLDKFSTKFTSSFSKNYKLSQ